MFQRLRWNSKRQVKEGASLELIITHHISHFLRFKLHCITNQWSCFYARLWAQMLLWFYPRQLYSWALLLFSCGVKDEYLKMVCIYVAPISLYTTSQGQWPPGRGQVRSGNQSGISISLENTSSCRLRGPGIEPANQWVTGQMLFHLCLNDLDNLTKGHLAYFSPARPQI